MEIMVNLLFYVFIVTNHYLNYVTPSLFEVVSRDSMEQRTPEKNSFKPQKKCVGILWKYANWMRSHLFYIRTRWLEKR